MTTRRFLSNQALLFLVVSILLVGGIVFVLHHTQADSALPDNHAIGLSVSAPSTIASRDAKRINDLKQMQGELELYFYECGYYPGTSHATPPCGPYVANNTWAGLNAALIGSTPIGVTSVPNDPTTGVNYFYSAAPHGIGYVLGATLEDQANPALTQTMHGTVNGVNCDSPMYCVQL
jgi:hypothetical protein